jgi:serine/threonine protein kinase
MSSPHLPFAQFSVAVRQPPRDWESLSSLRRLAFGTEDSYDPSSTHSEARDSEAENPRIADVDKPGGTRWIPLLALLSILESQGIISLGSTGQPFDPRQLIWTSAIGRGGEAVVKKITTLKTAAAHKRFFPRLTVDPRAIYQELAVLTYTSFNENRNIIKLLAVDKNYSSNYFSVVTELAEDGSLKEYLATHRIKQAQAQQFCSQITAALGYLHSEEILHNDVKAENVLITRDGAKLADFGHAIFNYKSQDAERLRREGRLIGTWRWTAPELFDVDGPRTLSATSDIYSLGFVIAFLAGGDFFTKYGLDDDLFETWKITNMVAKKVTENLTPASAWSLPILQISLQRRPADRFQSTDEILPLMARYLTLCETLNTVLIR